jgi:hypothetical protein
MSETKLEKAFLVALTASRDDPQPIESTRIEVQFNPENLKVSFANQIAQPTGGGNQTGTDGQQFVGAGSTKLALQLWFDVSAPLPSGVTEKDVRKLTQKVAYFITPQQVPNDATKFVPPKVRFAWGSFQFDGLMESLDESLEFFSSEGIPLRASVSFSLTQQKISKFKFRGGAAGGPPGLPSTPGERPLSPAPQGGSVAQMAAASGKAPEWKQIAAANNIENPRFLKPGALLDLSPVKAGGSLSIGGARLTPAVGLPAPIVTLPRLGLRR